MKNTLIILLAIFFSGYIGYSDLHQTDTPITVAALLVASFIVGLLVSKCAWVYGIIIGLGVPVWEIIHAGSFSKFDPRIGLFTILISIAGVYIGQMFSGFFIQQKRPQA